MEGTDDRIIKKTMEKDGTDGNRRKTRKGRMTEQSRRQRKETERMGMAKTHRKGSGTGGNVAGRPENDGESPRKYGT